MTPSTFFRPTPAVLIGSIVITSVAAALMLRMLVCALNGSQSCLELPAVVQFLLIAILWPSVVVVRFAGVENMQLVGITGVVLSLLWVYLVLCVKRWLLGVILKDRRKES